MLFIHAFVLLLRYDALARFSDFETIYSLTKSRKVSNRPINSGTVENVCNAIKYACAWYPKDVLCLQRSFVTVSLLRKHGIGARLVIGSQTIPFKAHAWVEVRDQPVAEGSPVRATYAVLDRC
jgi:hypothetical protein